MMMTYSSVFGFAIFSSKVQIGAGGSLQKLLRMGDDSQSLLRMTVGMISSGGLSEVTVGRVAVAGIVLALDVIVMMGALKRKK